jgi:hypothetical protein
MINYKVMQIMPAMGWGAQVLFNDPDIYGEDWPLVGWALCEVTDDEKKADDKFNEVVGLIAYDGIVKLCNSLKDARCVDYTRYGG